MGKSVFVNIKAIDWDTEDYGEYDDDYDAILELPDEIEEFELVLDDDDDPLDEELVEEVLMNELTEEHGFCINFITWDYIKYKVSQRCQDNKYLVKDLMDGNKVIETFDTKDEAERFIDIMLNLTNEQ